MESGPPNGIGPVTSEKKLSSTTPVLLDVLIRRHAGCPRSCSATLALRFVLEKHKSARRRDLRAFGPPRRAQGLAICPPGHWVTGGPPPGHWVTGRPPAGGGAATTRIAIGRSTRGSSPGPARGGRAASGRPGWRRGGPVS